MCRLPELNCSINEYFFALISCTIHLYLKTLSNTKEIKFLMPVSLREKPKKICDLKLNNTIVGLPVKLSVHENFEESLLSVKRKLETLKNSYLLYGYQMMSYVFSLCSNT